MAVALRAKEAAARVVAAEAREAAAAAAAEGREGAKRPGWRRPWRCCRGRVSEV